VAGLNILLLCFIHKKMVIHVITQHQQLAVYKRTVKKLKIKQRNRIFGMILSRFWSERMQYYLDQR